MNKRVDLTNLIIDDLNHKREPNNTNRLLIFVILIIVLITIVIFYLKSVDNKTIENNVKTEKTIQKEAPIKKKVISKKVITQKVVKEKEKKQSSLWEAVNVPNYYIQVYVYKKNINKSFLKKIESNDLKYIIKKSGKFNKVLVGPYSGYSSAKKNLADIKSKIKKDAFIIKE